MKRFIVDNHFWEVFPEAMVGVLVFRNIRSNKKRPLESHQKLMELLSQANKTAKRFVAKENLFDNEIPELWQEAYRSFPTKEGACCSLEKLLQQIHEGKEVTSVCPIIDIVNVVALRHGFPTDAFDMDKIEGDIHLGPIQASTVLPVGEAISSDPVVDGEIVYSDANGAICRCLNWQESDRVKATFETNAVFISIECIQPERLEDLQKALEDITILFSDFMEFELINKAIAHQHHPQVALEK